VAVKSLRLSYSAEVVNVDILAPWHQHVKLTVTFVSRS